MSDVQITFLGTSNAVPTAQRNHPALWLEYEGERILIDCGEGTQRQCKHAQLNPCKLTRILLTHLHGDHVLGLPGLLETLAMSEYAKQLQIYGPKGTIQHIDLLQKIYGRFHIQHRVHELPQSIETKEWKIEVMPMVHSTPIYAFAFIIKERRKIDKAKIKKLKLPNSPIIGELQRGKDITYKGKKIRAKDVTFLQPGKKIAIIMDTKFNEKAIQLAKNADILICEATYANEEADYASEFKHLTASQAATIAKKANVKRLVLTHIAQRYEHNLARIQTEAKKVFKNVSVAKDFDKLVLK